MSRKVLADLSRLKPRTEFDRNVVDDAQRRAWLETQILNFPSSSIVVDGNPVAIFGITHANNIGEAWMVTGEGFEKHVRKVIRRHRELMPQAAEILSLRRIHMMIDPARAGAVRFAEAIGFSYEATIRRMGLDGQDIDFYTILPGE